jgi:peptidoglycan/xylan/chitin deacetylase (PgdA/CDA1 family)
VLTYHRVTDPDTAPLLPPQMHSATPQTFSQQMALIRREFCPIGIEQVLAALDGEGHLPSSAVLVTFDDAYQDFAAHAWPILQQQQVPCLLFVPTAFPGEPQRIFWWDQL